MRRVFRMRHILGFGAALALSAAFCAMPAQARRHAAKSDISQAELPSPTDGLKIGEDALTHANGRSLEQLAIRWTDWMIRYNDRDGDEGNSCDKNQRDSVWFLMDNGIINRDISSHQCRIRSRRYILIPIAYSFKYADSASKADCAASLQEVKAWTDALTGIKLDVDGRTLTDFRAFRVSPNRCQASPRAGRRGKTPPYAIDGYWVILPPLAKGHHEIHVSYQDRDSHEGAGVTIPSSDAYEIYAQ